MPNPFRIGGTISGEYFADREVELRKIVDVLVEPQAKLVVYGPRRMGKSSALEVARARVERRHHQPVVFVDVSTASGEADVAIRLLREAVAAMGKRWQETLKEFAQGLSARLTLSVDPVSQLPSVSFEPAVRDSPAGEQRNRLGEVLDTLDRLAERRGKPLGVILDEFQDLHKFGGEASEWHLRGVVQRHKHLSYVLAGSRESLITAMIGDRNRAFYDLAERLHMGPIDAEYMARWIDKRFARVSIEPNGCGGEIVRLAGLRTRDRVRLARAVYAGAQPKGVVGEDDVAHALDAVVQEQADEYESVWRGLTPTQQNVLRAVAAGASALFSSDVRERYGLGRASGTTAKAIARLLELEHLARAPDASTYAFDNPFFGRWVSIHALPDVVVHAMDREDGVL
jgi:hypothetical protein